MIGCACDVLSTVLYPPLPPVFEERGNVEAVSDVNMTQKTRSATSNQRARHVLNSTNEQFGLRVFLLSHSHSHCSFYFAFLLKVDIN